nr:DNA modification methylase [Verrucomicrobiales bacterium]
SVVRLAGHLGCITFCPEDGNVYGSLEQKHDAIGAGIIRRTGWRHPIIISRLSGCIVAGHCRLYAARVLKLEAVPVVHQDFDSSEEELSFLLADNRLAEFSTRDDATVAAILKELGASELGLDLSGYDQFGLSKLLAKFAPADNTDSTSPVVARVEELQRKWQTAPGQVWQLGKRRLVIGDAENAATWEALACEPAAIAFMDPPYGIDYENKAGQSVANDDLRRDDLAGFVTRVLNHCIRATVADAAFYIWHASSTRRDFEFACNQVGLIERQYITWVKDGFVLGRCHYHWQTEHAFYLEKSGAAARWMGDRTQATVWRVAGLSASANGVQIGKDGILVTDGSGATLLIREGRVPKSADKLRHFRVPKGDALTLLPPVASTAWQVSRDPIADYLHPNQKPPGLASIAIANHTQPGEIVLDPFSGSGSTLIACEQTGRVCRAIEIDPGYAAVILERWKTQAEGQPRLEPLARIA